MNTKAPLLLAGFLLALPAATLDETWGKGFIKPDVWVQILYADVSGKE